MVRCTRGSGPCGSEQLEFHHPGGISVVEGHEPFPTGAEIGEGSFFIIKAVCVACGNEHVLFDCDFHGRGGFLLHDTKKAALPRPRLWPWRRVTCGSAAHPGEVSVIRDFKDRYFEEGYSKKFGEDRWPDAYGCFTMRIKCRGCGHETPLWVDYEAR